MSSSSTWEKVLKVQKQKRHILTALVALSFVVLLTVTAIMTRPANTATPELICGKEEHVHTDSCYATDKILTCGQEETVGHTHTDACYTAERVLTCGQVESETHAHTDACYTTENVLTCGKEETAGHTHTDACYTEQQELICGKEEHVHTAECYEQGGTLTAEAEDQTSAVVDYEAGVLHSGTAMTITRLSSQEETGAVALVQAKLTQNGSTNRVAISASYDIAFDRDGNRVEPDGTVSVTLVPGKAVAPDSDKVEWKLYHIADDNSVSEVNSRILTDGNQAVTQISFHADSFSKYVIAGIAPAENEKAGQEAEQTVKGDSSESQVQEEDTNSPEADSSEYQTSSAEEQGKSSADQENTSAEQSASAKKLSAASNDTTVNAEDTSDSTAIDLTPYIQTVDVQKNVNGTWTTLKQFNNGDTVRISLNYSIPSGVITSSNKTVTYQLPNGVKLSKAESGNIVNNGTTVGTYTIDTDGKVTLTYNDNINKDLEIDGTLTFEGTVSNTGSGDSGQISFGGTSVPITITKPVEDKYDISTDKNGTLSEDNKKVTYTITTSTKNGTGNTVTIEDQFQNNSTNVGSFSYDQNTLKIVKVDADGKQTTVTPTTNPTFSSENGITKFEIKDLPALNAGEKYIVTYDADITSSDTSKTTTINNQAHVTSGGHGAYDWNSVTIHTGIEKEGSYDPDTNSFLWKIKLNNGNKQNVSTWKVKDPGTGYEIIGDVSIYRVENNNNDVGVESPCVP